MPIIQKDIIIVLAKGHKGEKKMEKWLLSPGTSSRSGQHTVANWLVYREPDFKHNHVKIILSPMLDSPRLVACMANNC